MGHTENHIPFRSVLKTKHFIADILPTSGLLPDFGRMEDGENQLLGSDGGHLLADDGVDLVQHPETERQKNVKAGRQLSNHPRPDHEFMTHCLGV